ncbi:MAG: sigma-70 family RNA polymerase sigma factor [Clostridiales bacterium]|nr:sigma-70 family RNA polymerase sigma factor [Clostridiales bacterium]
MNENNDELELIGRAGNGDGDAFGTLMKRHESMIFNAVMGMVRNTEDARDITQDAFFKAYRSLKSFRGDCKFSSWVYRIAVNAAKDFLRSESRRPHISLDADTEDDDGEGQPMQIADDSPAADPQASAEASETQRIVRAALARLSDNHREILILRDIEGYSYEEIADMLGLELGTVKSRINRARIAMRQELVRMNIL